MRDAHCNEYLAKQHSCFAEPQSGSAQRLTAFRQQIIIIGAMSGAKPTWTLAGHLGIIGHDKVLVSLAAPHFINGRIKETKKLSINLVDEAGKINYNTLKPVLFEFPTYHYLKTGDVLGKCLSFKPEK